MPVWRTRPRRRRPTRSGARAAPRPTAWTCLTSRSTPRTTTQRRTRNSARTNTTSMSPIPQISNEDCWKGTVKDSSYKLLRSTKLSLIPPFSFIQIIHGKTIFQITLCLIFIKISLVSFNTTTASQINLQKNIT